MTFEFRPDREAHLRMLCEQMGKTPDDFINEAVLTFMEDYEDGRDGAAAYAEHLASGEKTITLEEMMREYGLEAGDLDEGAEADEKAGSTGPNPSSELPAQPARQAA